MLLTAYLAGLFVARNSDIWRHMAVGRQIVQLKYAFGSDPLSFTGAGRAWVNQNWLFDLLAYGLYSLDGTGVALVVAKAFAFATAFTLLFALRRPAAPLWPWCVAAALGVLACAPRAELKPTPFALALLALALVALFKGDWGSRRWRMPLLYGGLVAVWANVDASAFLGPFLVLLLLVGEIIQKRFLDPADGGVLAPPPADALLRTLPLALAGWLLNPAFLGALIQQPGEALAQLFPTELVFGFRPLVADDPDLSRQLSLSAYTGEFFKTEALGGNANGYAFLALLAAGGLLPLLAYRHLRAAHVLAWVGFALLPLGERHWIPFAAVLSVPLAAAYANLLSGYIGQVDDQRGRVLLLSSGIGRILCVVAVLAMVLAAVPGWLHPRGADDNPGYARRIDWGVEADPAVKATWEGVQRWRTGQQLPGHVRLLLAHPELGDYAAWYAPGERVFVNTRYQFHRAELPDLVDVRKAVRPTRNDLDRPAGDLTAIADRHAAGGIALGRGFLRLDTATPYLALEGFGPAGSLAKMYGRVWRLDGRTAVIGRSDLLAFDAARAAFGPQPAPVPDGSAKPSLPPAEGVVARFLDRPRPPAGETDDALAYATRASQETLNTDAYWQRRLVPGSFAVAGGWTVIEQRTPGGSELGYELLALRAAYAGVARNPDDPAAYRALAVAARGRFFGQASAAAQARNGTNVSLTALARAAARYPAPDQPRDRHTRAAIEDGLDLFQYHLRAGHLDLARKTLDAVMVRMEAASPTDLPSPFTIPALVETFEAVTRRPLTPLLAPGDKEDALAAKGPDWVRKRVGEVRDKTKDIYSEGNARFNDRLKSPVPATDDLFAAAKLTLAEQYVHACQRGLPQKALDLVPDNLAETKPGEFAVRLKSFPQPEMQAIVGTYRFLLTQYTLGRPPRDVDLRLQAIDLMLKVGRVETAAEQLAAVEAWLADFAAQHPDDPSGDYWREAVAALNAEVARLVGDFTRGSEWVRGRLKGLPRIDTAEAVKILDAARAAPLDPDPVGSLLGVGAWLEWNGRMGRLAGLVNVLRLESQLQHELGLYGLASGHPAAAREGFVKALKPQGVPLEKLGIGRNDPARATAERYLRLLRQYE